MCVCVCVCVCTYAGLLTLHQQEKEQHYFFYTPSKIGIYNITLYTHVTLSYIDLCTKYYIILHWNMVQMYVLAMTHLYRYHAIINVVSMYMCDG